MRSTQPILILLAALALLPACADDDDDSGGSDSDTDADSDTDTDTDADTDVDADSDTETETGTGSETDTDTSTDEDCAQTYCGTPDNGDDPLFACGSLSVFNGVNPSYTVIPGCIGEGVDQLSCAFSGEAVVGDIYAMRLITPDTNELASVVQVSTGIEGFINNDTALVAFAISTIAGDFSEGVPAGCGPESGMNPSISFANSDSVSVSCILEPGVPYYMNVEVTGVSTCDSPLDVCFTGLVTQTISEPWQTSHDGVDSCP